ncbi:hypothetical protein [Mycobacterium kubicae]|uniref:hypothetical protein n=1 Tax=Mycobacterium kubicae TaxID=120959 RepID=UPI00186160BD|nr:hypothetical protein [Mycobacterium kubicae]QNI13460.1 hypothetical protein GAN18_21905 [Mycobacterium kubicae]
MMLLWSLLIASGVGGIVLVGIWLVFRLSVSRLRGRTAKTTTEEKLQVYTFLLSAAQSVIAIAGIVIGTFFGVYIPTKLDQDNSRRQMRATCFAAIISLRKTITIVKQGYTIAPLDRDQRLADWESLRTELDNVSFGCHEISLGAPSANTSLQQLRKRFTEAEKASESPNPDMSYINGVADWSLNALSELQADR